VRALPLIENQHEGETQNDKEKRDDVGDDVVIRMDGKEVGKQSRANIAQVLRFLFFRRRSGLLCTLK